MKSGWSNPIAVRAAAEQNLADLTDEVKDNPASISARGAYGETPMHWAVINDDHLALKVLLYAGADMAAQDCLGRSPADLIRQMGRHQLGILAGRVAGAIARDGSRKDGSANR